MKTLGTSFAFLLLTALLAAAAPVRIIFDTDFMSDCDDAGALALLHALADNDECVILGTFCSGLNPASPAAVSAVNTYYGRGDLPVAALKGSGVHLPSKFAEHLASHFPHAAFPHGVPDALPAYREQLAAQPDRSVVIVTVGYATNLRNLLASPPDAASSLGGRDLITTKVLRWVNMGGNFEHRPGIDKSNVNWTRDAKAAVETIAAWPTEIVFNGREIGHSMKAGVRLAQTSADNPVRAAYEQYFGGCAKDRHCADLSATLFAVRGLGHGTDRYWELERGRIAMNPDASFTWTPGAGGPRAEARLRDALSRPGDGLLAPSQIQAIIENLMVQPPRRDGSRHAQNQKET